MNKHRIQKFQVIGISVRTTNEGGQSSKDIPALWNKFMSENILEKIPHKIDDSIYCIYTDYEKDHTKPYTTLIGCRVSHIDTLPPGMTGKTCDEGLYITRSVKGNLLEGLVIGEWMNIWNSDLQRTFVTDFEVYGEKAKDYTQAEVDIFVGVH